VSDLPSMREVLDDRTAIFFTPDDPQSLYEGVSRLLHDRQLADTIASHALAESKKYSWEGRARSIMDFANYRV
jgi:glycosyltransferase involved in cell wall biosynthesis